MCQKAAFKSKWEKKKKTPRRNVCLKRKEAPLGVFTYDWMPCLDINQRRVFDKPRTCKAGVRQITRTPDTHKTKSGLIIQTTPGCTEDTLCSFFFPC